ncbi:hypothetical protein Bca52824_017997 [Brassica carinata]|uniref:Replication factor A C-terminal domain-containing protein n=1 Tax=Brassica carinata TaxID=52824 RepID=A0A8X8AWY7_BRACI|nr:hypothetical protein Bca52824_017997 [Brassica carinata]
MKKAGVPDPVKTNGVAAAPSSPVNPVAQTVVSSADVNSMKSKGLAAASSSPIKPIGKSGGSSVPNIGVTRKSPVSSGAKGKAIVSDTVGEGTVVQGFIPCGRIDTYLRHMKAGATYRLNKFFGSRNKTNYRVSEGDVTVSFSWNSVLSVLDDSTIHFPDDRLRIHGYREFDAACDLKGDLYDYIGHIKLVNGQVPSESLVLDEAGIAAARRVDLHVQTHDDPVLKLCLWDKAAFDFCEKFKASGCAARVILVTALNPKRFGVLSLSSMTPSRVFLDGDVQETRNYLSWLDSNLDVANRVKADVVIKPEPATLGELFAYMKQASAKVAWFECTATIDDVVHRSMWYYIGCGECHTKATKGPTTLMFKKCGKSEIVGVAQYLSRLSVYDHNDQAVFVVLGDAGEELTGKKAAELVESYYQGQLLEGRLTRNRQPNDPNHLIEGDVYEISGFSVLHNQRQRKLTQLPYYIQLGQETKMSNVTGIGPIFPLHNLSPQNYESLLHLATIPTYLPDVVGQIRMMQNTRPFHPEDNTELTVGLLLNR